jgi:hypothetical protein
LTRLGNQAANHEEPAKSAAIFCFGTIINASKITIGVSQPQCLHKQYSNNDRKISDTDDENFILQKGGKNHMLFSNKTRFSWLMSVLALVTERDTKQIKIQWQFSIQSARSRLNSHYTTVHADNVKFKET